MSLYVCGMFGWPDLVFNSGFEPLDLGEPGRLDPVLCYVAQLGPLGSMSG